MLFVKYKCPKCGKQWLDFQTKCECGYEQKAIGCPECMNVLTPMELKVRKKYLHKQNHIYALQDCDCSVPYVELDITVDEYSKLKKENDKRVISWKELNIPWEYYKFLMGLWDFPLYKYLYDNVFNHEKLNHKTHNVAKFLAYLDPSTQESKNYFQKECGASYEELYRKTHNSAELRQLNKISDEINERIEQRKIKQEALHPTPKCPACGSTRLTRISTVSKAAKIYAFGIYGAGDVGKTYRCNNCGVKF